MEFVRAVTLADINCFDGESCLWVERDSGRYGQQNISDSRDRKWLF